MMYRTLADAARLLALQDNLKSQVHTAESRSESSTSQRCLFPRHDMLAPRSGRRASARQNLRLSIINSRRDDRHGAASAISYEPGMF